MDEFQILTAFAEILPLTVAIPVFRVAFSQIARPRGVSSWCDLAFAVALMPVLVFLPGVAADSFVMVSGEFDGGSEAVFETLSVLGLLSAQGTAFRVQKRHTDSAFAPVESKPMKSGVALPAHRARLIGSPGLRDPWCEAELAERHDAVLKAWIASGSAGGERMIELVEFASHWSQAPLSPEYRRAIEMLEDHWENDLDNRINEITATPPEIGTPGEDPGIGTFGADWYDIGYNDEGDRLADSYRRLMTAVDDGERRYAARCRRMLEDDD